MLKYLWKILKSIRGTAVDTVSTQYSNYVTNRYPPDPRDIGGRVVPMYFTYTVVANDTVSGTVSLGVHPANWRCVGGRWSTDGLGTSASAGQSPVVGDGTTANKYMLATDFDVAATAVLASTAMGYTPTTDKTITLTFGSSGDPLLGSKFKGTLWFIPPS